MKDFLIMRTWMHNRLTLITILVIAVVVVGLDWLVATNDDSWSDTQLVIYNLIGVVGILAIVASLALLVMNRRRSASH